MTRNQTLAVILGIAGVAVLWLTSSVSPVGPLPPGADSFACQEAVRISLPAREVVVLPDEKFKFVARRIDGSLWYVETMSKGTNITTLKPLAGASPHVK